MQQEISDHEDSKNKDIKDIKDIKDSKNSKDVEDSLAVLHNTEHEYMNTTDNSLYERHLDDIMTDKVDWTMFSSELLEIMHHDGKNYMKLAKFMAHTLRTQWTYYREKDTDSKDVAKRKNVYLKLVYKYIYDHKLCMDNFF
jgi:hypothetical protein